MSDSQIQRLAVIGSGKMGSTLIHAAIAGGRLTKEQIVASGPRQEKLDRVAADEGVAVTRSNVEAVSGADTVLLCVKPQTIAAVLHEIGPSIGPAQTVISIAAGITLDTLEHLLPAGVPVVRAMPNTPSLVGAGMTALCGGSAASAADLAKATEIFEQTGRTRVLGEKYFDAVTGLSASGPAFVYIIIEALAEGGVKMGLPRQVAIDLAAQACLGSAQMVLETGGHPALLKDDVTTPAGCTVDGILKLEEGGLRVTLIKAVVEATQRAGGLGSG